ncbi:MAG: hypothetical protein Q9190_001069 [Brigantiaea leucoxantha]
MPATQLQSKRYSKLSPDVDDFDDTETVGSGSTDENVPLSRPYRGKSKPFWFSTGATIINYVTIATIASGLGFALGAIHFKEQKAPSSFNTSASQASIRSFTTNFQYNESFAAPPSAGGSELLWDSLIPSSH